MKKIEIQMSNEYERIMPPLVSDGLLASVGNADGKLIPVLIIDTSKRPDIENLMEIHSNFDAGDVESIWLKSPKQKNTLGLLLNFLNPTPCKIMLEFDLLKKYGLIDCIVRVQGLYLQCGRDGDRLASTMGHKRILLEVPSKHFQKEWNEIFQESAETKFMKDGLSRKEARISAKRLLTQWREMISVRMKDD